MRCDVAIGALSAPHGRTPCIVSEDVIKKMKSGSVIVDVILTRGCFETSKVTTTKTQHLLSMMLFIIVFLILVLEFQEQQVLV